jgi:hypothetical protein
MLTRMEAKKVIEQIEYDLNGFRRLSGNFAKAVNIRRIKGGYKADIVLSCDFGEDIERIANCVYPDKILENSEVQ